MRMYRALMTGLVAAGMLWSGTAMGQTNVGCDPQTKVNSPEKVEGQVI